MSYPLNRCYCPGCNRLTYISASFRLCWDCRGKEARQERQKRPDSLTERIQRLRTPKP